ncbi:MAG TPA: hypothetical protein VFO10_18865 [Oligoflexus sp.]|nr:hypothetical protein [Oligoflexus sp.]HET9239330.1 hypothetical protein [Oligoflexus sp.]
MGGQWTIVEADGPHHAPRTIYDRVCTEWSTVSKSLFRVVL